MNKGSIGLFCLLLICSFSFGQKSKGNTGKTTNSQPVVTSEPISDPELNSLLRQKFANEKTEFLNLEDALKNPDAVFELHLNNMELTSIPADLSKFKNLIELDLSGNNIEKVSGNFSAWPNLEVLNLSNNKITEVPAEVCSAKQLKSLYLNGNQIKSLGNELSCLNGLEKLFIQNNQLSSLSSDISKLSNLKYLYIFNNKLTTLPEQIAECKNLQILLVQNNKLSEYPFFTERLDYLNQFQFEPQDSKQLLEDKVRKAAIQNSYSSTGGTISPLVTVQTSRQNSIDNNTGSSGMVQYQNVTYPAGFRPYSYIRTAGQVLFYQVFLVHFAVSKKFRTNLKYTRIYRKEQRLMKEYSSGSPDYKRINKLNADIQRIHNRIKK